METGNLEKGFRSGVGSFRLPGFKIFTKAFVDYCCHIVIRQVEKNYTLLEAFVCLV